MVRDELAGALAEAEDLAFLRGSGVGESPKGIRFWCPSSQVVNGTAATDAAIETDLVAMVARLVAAMRGRQSQPRWFMPSRSYYRLFNAKRATTDLLIFPEIRNTPPQLIGFPVTITDQIPVNLAPSTSTEILLADMSEVLIGDEMSLSIAFGCRRISR
jgi:HK97 family phage major capsid protein